MSDNKEKEKDFDDVSSLVSQLHLGGVRYREFGKPKASALPPATPEPVAAPQRTLAPAPVAAAPVAAPQPAAVAAAEAPRPRIVAPASPLSFTFERLRRQAIASTVRTPFITLNLPERHAVPAHKVRTGLRQRTLAAVFAELEGHARNRAVA